MNERRLKKFIEDVEYRGLNDFTKEVIFAELVEAVKYIGEFSSEISDILQKSSEGTLHVVTCNANHSKEVGGDMCSCYLGKVIKKLKASLKSLEVAKKECLVQN